MSSVILKRTGQKVIKPLCVNQGEDQCLFGGFIDAPGRVSCRQVTPRKRNTLLIPTSAILEGLVSGRYEVFSLWLDN